MVTIQPNMQVHDELAALFSRNLTLQQPPPPEPKPEPKIQFSASQHYYHSAHLVRQQQQQQREQQQQRPSSLPPPETGPSIEQLLAIHGVNPNVLSHAQIELFKTADDAQKQRLIELWSICPPTPSNQDNPALAWNSTSVEQEETLARMRYERQQQEEFAQQLQAEFEAARQRELQSDNEQAMSLDGTLVPFQGGDGRWITLANSNVQEAEPYMANGYERMAQREYQASSRPKEVYGHFGTAASGSNNVHQHSQATEPVYGQVIENQYGKYHNYQMRGTCGISAMDEMVL